MQKQESEDLLVCPSFSSYSSHRLVDVADQVTKSLPQNDDVGSFSNGSDFEFITFPKAADEVFFDGYDGPVFPIFNRDLLVEYENSGGRNPTAVAEKDVTAIQFPMRKLLIDDELDQRTDRDPPSCSSSEAEDLDGIPPGTYCVWTPNLAKSPSVSPSPSRCKKSSSTGSSSSRRWKLLDLLRRSNSDGKDSYVFLTPSSSASNLAKKNEVKAESSKEQQQRSSKSGESSRMAGKPKAKVSPVAGGQDKKVSAHEALYVRNRDMRKVDKRRSYLPYRQDLVGFGASINGMGRVFSSFPSLPSNV